MLTRARRILTRARRGLLLLRELRSLRTDIRDLTGAIVHLAAALESRTALDYPPPPVRPADEPGVEVAYVDTAEQAEWTDIELRLTAALGMPPSEDEILTEYLRRHPEEEGEVLARALRQAQREEGQGGHGGLGGQAG